MFIRPQLPHLIRQHRQITWAAKQLRLRPTPAEQQLWQRLKGKQLDGYKFRRQFALYNFIVDFYCHSLKLVIEVDGGIHTDQQAQDHRRDTMLQEHGYTVLRFTNEQVFTDIETVLKSISHSFEEEIKGEVWVGKHFI
ncbi:MAG: endonuclease domain-containing protein [Candidatus Kerfeldbacteria bacterium]|nr:endonuclease domain-containing protein [Candidatus Kerfeldbacteria bacterium]